MKKYIDADKAIEWAKENLTHPDKRIIEIMLDEVPAADVQEVVHCKDCGYFAEDMKCPYCDYWESVTHADDFCSNGMQMDGERYV